MAWHLMTEVWEGGGGGDLQVCIGKFPNPKSGRGGLPHSSPRIFHLWQ